MEEHGDNQRRNQRPPIDVASGTMRDGLRLAGFQLVEAAVNLIQLPGVGGMGVEPTGCRSDLLERVFVQRVLAGRARIAHCDGENGDALVFRNLGRLQGRHLAGGVAAVGERDEHAFLDLAAIEQIDG